MFILELKVDKYENKIGLVRFAIQLVKLDAPILFSKHCSNVLNYLK